MSSFYHASALVAAGMTSINTLIKACGPTPFELHVWKKSYGLHKKIDAFITVHSSTRIEYEGNRYSSMRSLGEQEFMHGGGNIWRYLYWNGEKVKNVMKAAESSSSSSQKNMKAAESSSSSSSSQKVHWAKCEHCEKWRILREKWCKDDYFECCEVDRYCDEEEDEL